MLEGRSGRPPHGYRLVAEWSRRWPEWPVSDQAIYQQLGRMRDRREVELVAPEDPSGRPGYRITDLGMDQLTRLDAFPLAEVEMGPTELFVRLEQAAYLRDPHKVLGLLDHYEQACLDAIAKIGAESEDADREPDLPAITRSLIAAKRYQAVQADLTWIELVREHIQSLIDVS